MAARKPRKCAGRVATAGPVAGRGSNYEKQITELKAQGESGRIDFRPQLAGIRNMKATRALLGDHDKLSLTIVSAGYNNLHLLATDVPESTSA